jgi:hypothetical protein
MTPCNQWQLYTRGSEMPLSDKTAHQSSVDGRGPYFIIFRPPRHKVIIWVELAQGVRYGSKAQEKSSDSNSMRFCIVDNSGWHILLPLPCFPSRGGNPDTCQNYWLTAIPEIKNFIGIIVSCHFAPTTPAAEDYSGYNCLKKPGTIILIWLGPPS